MAQYVTRSTYYNGKKYKVRGKTASEAAEKLGALKASLMRGDLVMNRNTTVRRWSEEWLEAYVKPRGLTAASYRTYTDKVKKINSAVGSMRLSDVREIHLQKLLNGMQGKSSSDTKKLRMVIRSMFGRAAQSRIIPFDPSAALELPKTTTGKRRSITDAERAAILNVAKTHRAGSWVLMMLYCGLRPGETAALQWKDVDLKKNMLHVSMALEGGSESLKDPKTDAGVRDVPIPAVLSDFLRPLVRSPFDYVFPQKNDKSKMMTHSSMKRCWESFRSALEKEMGAEYKTVRINGSRKVSHVLVLSVVADDLTPYCLRHTCCTDMQRAGVPINVAKEIMGHSDISVTANIYTHTTIDVIDDARKKLDALHSCS